MDLTGTGRLPMEVTIELGWAYVLSSKYGHPKLTQCCKHSSRLPSCTSLLQPWLSRLSKQFGSSLGLTLLFSSSNLFFAGFKDLYSAFGIAWECENFLVILLISVISVFGILQRIERQPRDIISLFGKHYDDQKKPCNEISSSQMLHYNFSLFYTTSIILVIILLLSGRGFQTRTNRWNSC